MIPPGSRPDRLVGLLTSLARQLELPFLSPGTPDPRRETDARGRHKRPTPVSSDALPPDDPRVRSIRLGERTLDYAFRRARRKTIGFSIGADGLTIAAPRWVAIRQVEEAIREREGWVLAKIADMQRHHAAIPQVRWEDGGTLPYLGESIVLRFGAKTGRTSAAFDPVARTLTLSLPPDATRTRIRDRVESWLQTEARALFRDRLAVYETRLGVGHRVLRLSSARTRWGSCSADGRILLNWRLIHFPLSSIDYVVAHELAHLKEMNHGPRFWATVESIFPDYLAAREQVKNPPPELMPTL